MLKTVWHWFFHSWTTWGPVRQWKMLNGGIIHTQERTCKVCGKIEERMF